MIGKYNIKIFHFKVYCQLKFVYFLKQCRRKKGTSPYLGQFYLNAPTARSKEMVHTETRSLRWWWYLSSSLYFFIFQMPEQQNFWSVHYCPNYSELRKKNRIWSSTLLFFAMWSRESELIVTFIEVDSQQQTYNEHVIVFCPNLLQTMWLWILVICASVNILLCMRIIHHVKTKSFFSSEKICCQWNVIVIKCECDDSVC